MYIINKITSNPVIDYAAEEMKKYLRMMMPECGDIKIAYAPDTSDGFRLGLMQDFGLDVSDAEDTELDDILYMDCDEKGGIIAGDNPRSVLLSVYEYFRQNGCRWLMPGVDGEYIPMQHIKPVKYRHVPSMRYRGWCNEGGEYQQCMLDAIEFAPKVGLNVFMLEFRIPMVYYGFYYDHRHNEENRAAEPVSPETVLQWKRQCEVEIAKRGLQFHDIGHGWNADSFGIDTSLRASEGDNEKYVSDEARQYLALIDGERKLNNNRPNYTNFCMSNDAARRKVVDYVVKYAKEHANSDYLHIWLADGYNNHCECEACKKKTPSDWYVILLNAIDEELTKQGLKTRLVFCAYVETAWAPVTEKLKNQKRFTLLLGPITRSYNYTLQKGNAQVKMIPYERNNITLPSSLEEYFAYFEEWKKMWKGSNLVYEYHFWRYQCYDLSGIEISRRISEDIKVYKEQGFHGIIEDGSQRSFFPTGLAFYTYARILYDMDLTPDEIAKDYFDTAFREAADKFYAYLTKLGSAFDFAYLAKAHFADESTRPSYRTEYLKALSSFDEIEAEGRALIREYYNFPHRFGTASVRLLENHLDYAAGIAKALLVKVNGDDEEASKLYHEFRVEFGKKEAAIEKYYDHYNFCLAYDSVFGAKSRSNAPVVEIEG